MDTIKKYKLVRSGGGSPNENRLIEGALVASNPIASGSFGEVHRIKIKLDKSPTEKHYAIKKVSIKKNHHDYDNNIIETKVLQRVVYPFLAYSPVEPIIKDLGDRTEILTVQNFLTHGELFDIMYYKTHPGCLERREDVGMVPKQNPFVPVGMTMKSYCRYDTDVERKHDMICLIALQMILGLYYLHSNGVFHMDIKPENVFVGSDGYVYIGDYGLISYLKERKNNIAERNPGDNIRNQMMSSLRGTPDFFSIDVWSRKGTYDSDYFAMACIVYEWVYGESAVSINKKNMKPSFLYKNKMATWKNEKHAVFKLLSFIFTAFENPLDPTKNSRYSFVYPVDKDDSSEPHRLLAIELVGKMIDTVKGKPDVPKVQEAEFIRTLDYIDNIHTVYDSGVRILGREGTIEGTLKTSMKKLIDSCWNSSKTNELLFHNKK